MIHVTSSIVLGDDEIKLDFIRASGPGGQNVNKVATAVQLRFDAVHSPSLPEDVRERLLHLARNRINSQGVLVIEARRYRTQDANRQDAIERLVQLIRKATERPKKRTRTKPTAASVHRRLEQKKRLADTKKTRRPIPNPDD